LAAATAALSDDGSQDFDIVHGPGQVEPVNSDIDSEADVIVKVEYPVASAKNGGHALPLRTRENAAAAAMAEVSGADSDSEWSVV